MDNLRLCFNAIMPLFVLMLLGYCLKRINFISREGFQTLDRLCFRIAIPIMLFYNIYNADFTQDFQASSILFLVISYLTIFLLSFFIIPRIIPDLDDSITVIHGICHGNLAVIGLPLIINLFGENNITTYSILTACTSPVINPLMVFLHTKLCGEKIQPLTLIKNMLTSPFLVGTLLGFLFRLLPFRLPVFLFNAIATSRNMATPLCLIALGGSFAFSDFRKYSGYISASVLLRCVFIPGVVFAIAVALGFRGIVLASIIIVFASPSATATYSYCASYSGNGKLAAQIVMYSSLFSILSIFLWVYFFLNLKLI